MTAADDPRDGNIPGPPYLTTEELRRDVSALREILQARLDGMDRATVVLSDTVNRTPTAIQIAVGNLRELAEEKLDSASRVSAERFESLVNRFAERDERFEATNATIDQKLIALSETFTEKFRSIGTQFIERDVRTEQAATASASALAAALQAAKEAVFEQAQAAAKAAEKTELSFSKQIDQIQLQIQTVAEGLGDKIDDLKGRIDRGEGQSAGVSDSAVSSHASATYAQTNDLARAATTSRNVSVAIASLGLLVSVIVVVVLIVHGG